MKLLLGLVALTTLAHADKLDAAKKINMREGMWELSGDLAMGTSKMASPATQQCLTKQDLVPSSFTNMPAGMACTTDQKISGSTVNWTIRCTIDGDATLDGAGAVTYAGRAFSGALDFILRSKKGEMKGSVTLQGKYVGACKT